MELQAFEYLKKSEESWWWKGRSFAVQRLLSAFVHTGGKKILDIGAGFGSMFPILQPYGEVTAFEPYLEAAEICKERGYARVLTNESELENFPQTFDLIGAFDVIEHIENDQMFVRNLFRLLKKGGTLIATVPAYQFLWSEHDVEHHHFRRHTRASMEKLLTDVGFEVSYSSYWNCILLPVAYVLRKLGMGGGENLNPRFFVNQALSTLVWLESRIMPFVPLPWGISVVVVARHPEN